jgi:hypothetical protein
MSGFGSKIGRGKPERRMIVFLRRHVCLQSIKDLFSMIRTQGVHFLSGIETWSFEFRRGRGNGWFVVGVNADKPVNESCNEHFSLEMKCELIRATKQKEGVKVIREKMEEEWDLDRVFLGVLPFSPNILKLVKLYSKYCRLQDRTSQVTSHKDAAPA